MKSAFLAVLITLVICLFSSAVRGDFVYNSQENRDPFIPLATKEGVPIGSWQTPDLAEEIVLEGIVWDSQGNSLAIVNGIVVKEGDRFFNLKVLEIKKKGIKLLKENKELIINLK